MMAMDANTNVFQNTSVPRKKDLWLPLRSALQIMSLTYLVFQIIFTLSA